MGLTGTIGSIWLALGLAAPVAGEPAATGEAVAGEPAATGETLPVAPAPVVAQGPAPVVAQGPAPAPVVVQQTVVGPPRGTWMRVGGGLAIGVGSLLAVSALVCYATTDALAKDDLAGRETLRLTAFGLGLGALVHIGAGVPLVVIGKQRKRRYDAWARERVAWRPRIAATGRAWSVGLTLRF